LRQQNRTRTSLLCRLRLSGIIRFANSKRHAVRWHFADEEFNRFNGVGHGSAAFLSKTETIGNQDRQKKGLSASRAEEKTTENTEYTERLRSSIHVI
jgi:hypothetical protein